MPPCTSSGYTDCTTLTDAVSVGIVLIATFVSEAAWPAVDCAGASGRTTAPGVAVLPLRPRRRSWSWQALRYGIGAWMGGSGRVREVRCAELAALDRADVRGPSTRPTPPA